MTEAESLQRAIHEQVQIVAYDPAWPLMFEQEKLRLTEMCPQLLDIQHIGSTAVPGLGSKPIIDIMASVVSMQAADALLLRLCGDGYETSAEFNASLGDRRWLMRHAHGHRTHHLHLVVVESPHWQKAIGFRDLLRTDPRLAADYAQLKQRLAVSLGNDREAYSAAKGEFIERALQSAT